MSNNGTDRDVAQTILSALDSIATAVTTINDNLYVPHITTQPTDQEGAVGSTVSFSVVANNVAAYQWQYLAYPTATTWNNSTDATTDTRTVTVSSAVAYDNRFRCQITGKDGSVIYTDVVKIVAPAAG